MKELASASRKLRSNKDFMKSSGIRNGTSDKAYNEKEETRLRLEAAARDAQGRGRTSPIVPGQLVSHVPLGSNSLSPNGYGGD